MERNDGYFARAAVTEALARRDEIVPELLRILEAVADDPQRYAKEPDCGPRPHSLHYVQPVGHSCVAQSDGLCS